MQRRKNGGILTHFGIAFLLFSVVLLVVNGIEIYINQKKFHEQQYEETAKNLSVFLESLILADPDDFLTYQNYIIEHRDEIDIPVDFDNYIEAKSNFYKAFAKTYPNKSYGVNMQFDEMTEELKKLYIIYRHEYFLQTFENARTAFNVPYTYYIVPDKDDYVYYVIDIERTLRDDGKNMLLCEYYQDGEDVMPVFYETWNAGKTINKFDSFDNEYGRTNSYYTVVTIGGVKRGVICVDADVTQMYKDIVTNTGYRLLKTGAFVIIVMGILLLFINQKYITKLTALQSNIKKYAEEKDPSVVSKIEKGISGHDEISDLSMQTAEMILELENYMHSLLSATTELTNVKALANKDALTGVSNKIAYDSRAHALQKSISEGNAVFAIVMIDMNYLKQTNDNYGHDVGNVALKTLARTITECFEGCEVFRIGGDEFTVIADKEQLYGLDEYIARFKEKIKDMTIDAVKTRIPLSAAVGFAVFNSENDETVGDVFIRADKKMYENKKAMKSMKNV